MAKRMLVDASHPEETRVVVLEGSKVEEFDYESASRRPLKGNIYLAKVTRVEPSLQACFVEYGGNRHGFLAFSEIHPDYYQIPKADRQALLEASKHEDFTDDDNEVETGSGDTVPSGTTDAASEIGSDDGNETGASDEENPRPSDAEGGIVEVVPAADEALWTHDPEDGEEAVESSISDSERPGAADLIEINESQPVERELDLGVPANFTQPDQPTGGTEESAEDDVEEIPLRRHRSFRRYKIQDVIKRRQVLLVQVVKEERGNKGAALTTYLSLAGRYCVLMPNTDRGGGISRKISNVADRRKLKEMATELEVPEGMGVIIRTAGAHRTKQEIRRDFEYLLRQWDAVRDLTLRSSAPTLVYEEGNLIKRTIRDLFSKDVDEVLVEGEHGFNEAHGFMTMLMPSHANAVKHYREHIPMFQRFGVEAALDSMFNPIVRLRSGGYIVINQTEALVAVDVNSGKATREHHIEDTALKTNLEAAEEIARQLRLRDLAGLVVIDFIDMEEHRNNRAVEKRLKDCLRHDRARIQLGRISPFGLLEMSRQRLRAGMIEGATSTCPHCEGRGVIRSVGSMALRILRAVEEYCQKEKLPAVTLSIPPEIALYILNHKRSQLTSIEDRYGVYVFIESRQSLAASAFEIARGTNVPFEPRKPAATAVTVESELESNDDQDDEDDVDDTSDTEQEETTTDADASPSEVTPTQDGDNRRRRKRRRRGRDRGRTDSSLGTSPLSNGAQPGTSEFAPTNDDSVEAGPLEQAEDASDDAVETLQGAQSPTSGNRRDFGEGQDGQRRRRRRGRRGQRGRRTGADGYANAPPANPMGYLPTPAEAFDAPNWPASGGIDTVPGERPSVPKLDHVRAPGAIQEIQATKSVDPKEPEPKAERTSIASFFGFGPRAEENPEDSSQTKKKGWWQKRSEG